jgi:hypothetical protein
MSGRYVLIASIAAVGGAGVSTLWGRLTPPYLLSGGGGQLAWRINSSTGDVSVCRPMGWYAPPLCSPWGATIRTPPEPPPSQPKAPPQGSLSGIDLNSLLTSE